MPGTTLYPVSRIDKIAPMQLHLAMCFSLDTYEASANSMSQMTQPKVSVIVPIYNGEQDAPDLVKCLQAQTYPADRVEYLLVDNASRDRTAEIIKAAEIESQERGITLRYISEADIQSSYAARNKGIRVSTGEILAFTDADCRPKPNWLESLVKAFEDEKVGLVVGAIEALPGQSLLEQYAARKKILSHETALVHPFCPFGKTANLATRRIVLSEVGLFRSHLTTGGDADFCWRVQRQSNWKFKFTEKAIVQHRHRTTLSDLISQFRRYGRSNRYLHELHGIDLMKELKFYQYGYRLSRWLVKELPWTGIKAILGKAALVDLVIPPIYLITVRAQVEGQREAKLPEKALQIEYL
jgi:cellulose synthase/poly-beta-1,6-N-acetylglucosamine synthase-like glycosyltransferase